MDTLRDDYRPSAFDATIAEVRYWAPTITDVARVTEQDEGDGWTISILPHASGACPVAVTLKPTGRLDLVIAGERYEDVVLNSPNQVVPLLERIVGGDVVQRRWVSRATGAHLGVETLVRLGDGLLLSDGPPPAGGAERRDRHFLPYRRRP